MTISSGLVDEARITPEVIFGGLVGAILWNLLTWLVGLPSSSSHALFGGLIGATWVVRRLRRDPLLAPWSARSWCPWRSRRSWPAGRARRHRLAYRIRLAATDARWPAASGPAQVVSASLVALAHGTNDAQKTMGVITLALITVGPAAAPRRPAAVGDRAAGLAIARAPTRRLADHPDAGPPDQRHREPPGLRRRDRAAPPSSSAPHTWASPCPPPRSPPARCSAPAAGRPVARCGGGSPAGWSSPGC